MAMDSPDWQNIITLTSGGGVSDAPDWQTVVTGPGGTQPVGGGGTPSFMTPYVNSGFIGVTMDPFAALGTSGLLSPNCTLMSFAAGFTGPVHNVYVSVNGGSGSLTPNETYAGIYDFGETTANTFTLLCTSASGAAATAWASQGTVPVAMSTNPTLTIGKTYAVAVQVNGGGLSCNGNTIGGGWTSPTFTAAPWQAVFGNAATSLLSTIAFSAVLHPARLYLAYVN